MVTDALDRGRNANQVDVIDHRGELRVRRWHRCERCASERPRGPCRCCSKAASASAKLRGATGMTGKNSHLSCCPRRWGRKCLRRGGPGSSKGPELDRDYNILCHVFCVMFSAPSTPLRFPRNSPFLPRLQRVTNCDIDAPSDVRNQGRLGVPFRILSVTTLRSYYMTISRHSPGQGRPISLGFSVLQ
jgi:hypothetical protein